MMVTPTWCSVTCLSKTFGTVMNTPLFVFGMVLISIAASPQPQPHLTVSLLTFVRTSRSASILLHSSFSFSSSSSSHHQFRWFWFQKGLSTITTADLFKTKFKSNFFPKVDQFSLLRVNSTRFAVASNASLRVWVEIAGIRSESRVFVQGYTVVGARSIVAELDQGNVTALVWDDDCSTCSVDQCLEGSCTSSALDGGVDCFNTKAITADPFYCSIKIYLVWSGRDGKNKKCSSIDKLPSRYYQYSFVSNVYDAMSGFWVDFQAAWSTPQD